MIKGLKIVGFLIVLVAFVGCEKCEKPVFTEDPFVNANDRSATDEEIVDLIGNKGGDSEEGQDNSEDGTITDPNEDEDYDGIVDPEEDEDFDKDDDGK